MTLNNFDSSSANISIERAFQEGKIDIGTYLSKLYEIFREGIKQEHLHDEDIAAQTERLLGVQEQRNLFFDSFLSTFTNKLEDDFKSLSGISDEEKEGYTNRFAQIYSETNKKTSLETSINLSTTLNRLGIDPDEASKLSLQVTKALSEKANSDEKHGDNRVHSSTEYLAENLQQGINERNQDIVDIYLNHSNDLIHYTEWKNNSEYRSYFNSDGTVNNQSEIDKITAQRKQELGSKLSIVDPQTGNIELNENEVSKFRANLDDLKASNKTINTPIEGIDEAIQLRKENRQTDWTARMGAEGDMYYTRKAQSQINKVMLSKFEGKGASVEKIKEELEKLTNDPDYRAKESENIRSAQKSNLNQEEEQEVVSKNDSSSQSQGTEIYYSGQHDYGSQVSASATPIQEKQEELAIS